MTNIPQISNMPTQNSYTEYIELITRLKIPEGIRRKFLLLQEVIQFSNLTKQEIESLILNFSADLDLAKMSAFRDELDDQTIIDMEQLQLLLRVLLKRSEQGFERKMQVSQYHFQQSQTLQEQHIQQGSTQKGFFSKLFRL